MRALRTALAGAAIATLTLAGAAAGAGPAMAAPAGVAVHHHHVKAHPHLAGGTYNFTEANGHGYAWGTTDITAGSQVILVTGVGRSLTWVPQGTFFGDQSGFIKLSNGNYVATNTACTGLTVKSGPNSGTTFALKPTGITHTWYVMNPYCDGQLDGAHDDTIAVYGTDHVGDQLAVTTLGFPGAFLKMTIT